MRIFIDQYKNISQLSIPVPNSRRIILLGKNGTGKTNVLEAIYFHKCQLIDFDTEYDGSYLMSLDVLHNPTTYYPNQELINILFNHKNKEDIQQAIMAFLEKMYLQAKRPLMRKLINDALESMHYATVNKSFDPSSLAVTRLVILNKIYQNAIDNHEKYIILMDSPELFAHPAMMDELTTTLQKLQEIGCMIIVSTHSQQVISRMFTSFSELIKLEKNADGKVQLRAVNMERISAAIHEFYDSDEYLKHSFSRSTHLDAGLLKLLDNNIEPYLITAFRDHIVDTFFADIVILGEGASEDVLFDYIENVVHPSWVSEFQVNFMTCMGKSTMPLYFIFLNGIGVKTFMLFDLDNTNNQVHLAYKEAFSRYFRAHRHAFRSYWLNPDLEGYLKIDEQERIQSLIKPVHIFNRTFLEKEENRELTHLLRIMEENIRKL